MSKSYFTYILTNKRNGTLYVGMTNDLLGRVYQHKQKKIKGFAKKYNIDKLVYYEECGGANATIAREKRLKKWNRTWKLKIIEEFNPNWEDLYHTLLSGK
jgi:putative endonuclease